MRYLVGIMLVAGLAGCASPEAIRAAQMECIRRLPPGDERHECLTRGGEISARETIKQVGLAVIEGAPYAAAGAVGR